MTKAQREELNMAIVNAYIDNLKESEAQEFLEECYNKLNELEEA